MMEMLVMTEPGERVVRPTAGELAALVRRIGAAGDGFLVAQRVPDLPDEYIQVAHRAGGDYQLEYRDGSHDRHFQTFVADPGTVADAMTGWACREQDWSREFEWVLLDMDEPESVPPLELSAEDRQTLEERLRLSLACGYVDRAALAEIAEEYLVTAECRPLTRGQARRLADALWLERVGEQAGWQGETDPERLSRAFARLREHGIVAREDFACCRTCGDAEIGAESQPGDRGFVYFHSQCTEGAALGQGLHLLYGTFDDAGSEATVAVGREVAEAVRAAGLTVRWDGDPARAIVVTPLDWRRRLVG
ncbi:DUF6891 domain-containing protein [Streptomyces fragilis]|uniref:DUF6891 domain-containing protein n=1 Tax=Streptomyces fragilis TaxID=67301 RepID=A0ABV2YQT4_9ACTN|nr:hypothetical protein [Streptomyces fragilis]